MHLTIFYTPITSQLLRLTALLYLKLLGWRCEGEVPKETKFIVLAGPHTSNWDFPLGILTIKALRLDVCWIGKHTIFRWPFGWLFRALGGIPVDRSKNLDLIRQMTDLFEQSDSLIFALAPEGTRSKTDHWKTGFHFIARAADVPIVMAYLDFAQKEVGIGGVLYPGDDIEADFEQIRKYYEGKSGKNPLQASLIQVRQRP